MSSLGLKKGQKNKTKFFFLTANVVLPNFVPSACVLYNPVTPPNINCIQHCLTQVIVKLLLNKVF